MAGVTLSDTLDTGLFWLWSMVIGCIIFSAQANNTNNSTSQLVESLVMKCLSIFLMVECLQFISAWHSPPIGSIKMSAAVSRSLWFRPPTALPLITTSALVKQRLRLSTIPVQQHTPKQQQHRRGHTALTQSEQSNTPDEVVQTEVESEEKIVNNGLLNRVKGFFMTKNKKDDDLTFRQRLAKMGVATVLSYGMVSNLSYCILVSLAWYAFSVQTGLSPLAKGQWKPFLAVYAGFWVFNNIIRPLRLGLSIAIAPSLDRLVLFFQNRLKVSKTLAITVTVIAVNVVGTILLMFGGVAVASILAGVPIIPPR